MTGHGAGSGATPIAFAVLVVVGGFVGLGMPAAAVEPSLPLLPTLAPQSALRGTTLALPSLPLSTLLPLPTASLPIATILPLPSAPLPIATILPLPSASLPIATGSPLPSASIPTATPRPSALTSRPPAAPSPAATAVPAPASTPAPTSTVPARAIPAPESVASRPAAAGLIVSDVSLERPVTVAVAAAHTGAGQLVWAVPGLVLGLPGVLLLAIVAAQLVGGAAFLGLTRRTLGGLGIDTEPTR